MTEQMSDKGRGQTAIVSSIASEQPTFFKLGFSKSHGKGHILAFNIYSKSNKCLENFHWLIKKSSIPVFCFN